MRICVSTVQHAAKAASRPLIAGRALASAFGIMLLILQLLAPAVGQAAVGQQWVEICGESGAELVQLDLAGEIPANPHAPCKICSDCVLCGAANTAATPSPTSFGLSRAMLRSVSYLHPQPDVAANAAQFWPDNRGPPRATPNIYQTANPSPMVHPRNSRRAPCT